MKPRLFYFVTTNDKDKTRDSFFLIFGGGAKKIRRAQKRIFWWPNNIIPFLEEASNQNSYWEKKLVSSVILFIWFLWELVRGCGEDSGGLRAFGDGRVLIGIWTIGYELKNLVTYSYIS